MPVMVRLGELRLCLCLCACACTCPVLYGGTGSDHRLATRYLRMYSAFAAWAAV